MARLDVHRVAQGGKSPGDIPRRLGLDPQGVGNPLVVIAGRRNRRLDVHPPIHHVEDGQQHRADDPRPARASRHHEGLVILQQQRRGHARKRSLARRNGVGAPGIHQPVGVGGIGRHRKIVHLVVENDSRAGHGNPRAVRGVDRHGDPHRPALAIGHRKVRGALVIGGQPGRLHRRRLGGIDPRALSPGVFARNQARNGHIDEIGVAHIGRAIGEGEFHGFCHPVNARRTAGAGCREIETLENVEALEKDRATRRRRRKRVDRQVAIAAANRRPKFRGIARQVGLAEDATPLANFAGDRGADAPALNNPRPLLGDGPERPGEVRLNEHLAHFGLAVIGRRSELDARGLGKAGGIETILQSIDAPGLKTRQGKAFGKPNRRLQNPGQGQRAETREHQRHPRRKAGNRHGEGASDRRMLGQLRGEIHVPSGRGRGGLPRIEGEDFAVRVADQRKCSAPETGRKGLGHGHREGRRHRGIDRIAPGGENRGPRLGGQGR